MQAVAFPRPAVRLPNKALMRAAAAWLLPFGLAGCASTAVESQWVDRQAPVPSLAGARVYVTCQAADTTVRLVCVDRFAAQLKAMGAVPVPQPPPAEGTGNDARAVDAARSANAAALLATSIEPQTVAVSAPPTFSIGIGGFGIGGGPYSGGGVGVGVAAPMGGAGSASTGYGASSSLTDVASGRMLWSAKASAPPSADVNQQLSELSRVLLEAARSAGLFAR